ncbi:MAG: hypothetical protein U1E76_00930 [Planctomycetota bacterium]
MMVWLQAVMVARLALCSAPDWQNFTLKNGVRVSVLVVADSPKQATFTFLPLSLLNDDPHRAQFAHLIEHLLIRSTDPDLLTVEGVALNGETGASGMRLETLADRAQWQAALARHVRWVTAREFDDEVLEREKLRIQAEEESTCASGYTHKWAAAAWNQVVRCGLDHAAVHGDVARATVEQVRDDVLARVAVDASLRIVSVGPASADAIRAALEQEFLGAAPVPARRPAAKPTAARTLAGKPSREATWDLRGTQYLEWYALPGDTPKLRALAFAVSQLLTMQLGQDAALARIGAKGLAEALGIDDGARVISLSVSVPAGAEAMVVERSVRAAIDAVARLDLAATGGFFAQQLELPRDFAALRRPFAGSPQADLVEAQTVLSLVHTEVVAGLSAADLASAAGVARRRFRRAAARGARARAWRRAVAQAAAAVSTNASRALTAPRARPRRPGCGTG